MSKARKLVAIAGILLLISGTAMASVGGAAPAKGNSADRPTPSVGGATPLAPSADQELTSVGGAAQRSVGGAQPTSLDPTVEQDSVGGASPQTLLEWFLNVLGLES